MKNLHDLLDMVYPIVRVSGVTTTLDGKVYRTSRPINALLRDVVILALPIGIGRAEDIDVQQCVIIINCYAADIAPGIPDETHLRATTAAVIAAIEAYAATTKFLLLEVTSQALMADFSKVGHSYSSIRVNCAVQFET